MVLAWVLVSSLATLATGATIPREVDGDVIFRRPEWIPTSQVTAKYGILQLNAFHQHADGGAMRVNTPTRCGAAQMAPGSSTTVAPKDTTQYFHTVIGEYIIPNVTMRPAQLTMEMESSGMFIWTGMDGLSCGGQDITAAPPLLRAGSYMSAVGNNGIYEHFAFGQILPFDKVAKFGVEAIIGDAIRVNITMRSHTAGTFTMRNLRTGEVDGYLIDPFPKNIQLCGWAASWQVEDTESPIGQPGSMMSQFSPVQFNRTQTYLMPDDKKNMGLDGATFNDMNDGKKSWCTASTGKNNTLVVTSAS